MKKLFILIGLILLFQNLNITALSVSAAKVFSEDGNKTFGLKNSNNEIIAEPIYRKMIKLGDNAYIIQNKKYKFGIMDDKGNILIKPKFRHADRVLGKYAKLGNSSDYGLYDETGNTIIPPEYDAIELLFGGMLLTYKNYHYGVSDFNGKVLLDNKFNDIYMPKPNIIRLNYEGQWYEIEQVTAETLTLPEDIYSIKENQDFKVTNLVTNTGVMSGYSVLTFTDYLIKIFSSISPAHEATIDELMFSQGAETVNILIKFTWLPKYPFTYAKNYYHTVRNPNNGPLADIRTKLIRQIK